MDEIRWQAMSHREIYDAVWAGSGHLASGGAQVMWTKVQTRLENIDQILVRATNKLRDGWDGTSADQAARSLSLLGSWASSAVRTATQTATALETQAQYVADLRNNMPKPPDMPAEGDDTVQGYQIRTGYGLGPDTMADAQPLEAEQAAAAQRAVELMETYTNNSIENKQRIYAFATPITVTADPAGVPVPGLGAGGIGNAAGPVAPLPLSVSGPPALPPTPGPAPGIAGAGIPVPIVGGPGVSGGAAGRPGQIPGGRVPTVPTRGSLIPPSGGYRSPGTDIGAGGRGFPGSAGGSAEPGAGGRAPGAGLAGSTAADAARSARNPAGTHGFFPPGAGGFGAQPREHRRPSYLVDETDAFGDHRWFTEQVITPTDPLPHGP